MPVYLLGTLDTKGREIGWIRDRFRTAGVACTVVDAGCAGEPSCSPDITADQVFAAGGTSLSDMRQRGDRGLAIRHAAAGVSGLVLEAHRQGLVDGVLAVGGSAGTTIGTAAMRPLPLDVPKVMVSTMASGQTRPYVAGRNIFLLNSVVDIAGVNRISRTVLSQAVDAMVGMVKSSTGAIGQPKEDQPKEDRPLIAATMFGVTTPCVMHAQSLLEAAGYEVLVFHATGNGGEAMEGLIRDGLIAGVLDITTTELADELVGGTLSAGPDRLTAAADNGVPQVISAGALDMVNFGPKSTVPEKFNGRTFYEHNASVTLMRTTMDECQRLGEEIGRKATRSTGPVSILFPSLGVSAIDVDGQPFDNWAARMAIWAGLQSTCGSNVQLELLQHRINDKEFAAAAANRLLQMLHQKNSGLSES
ncbi:MAG: Tm-1-like ATP-binding domain-containing protein [Planctomycetaceae bacterium]